MLVSDRYILIPVLLISVYSMSGHQVVLTRPNTCFYAATMFAVTALTEGIRLELREMKSNVKVTVRHAFA